MERDPYDAVLVDDADDVRSVVGRQLRLSGRFDVVGEGRTGADAISLAALHRPAVMVLDASMPDMDGLEALPGVLKASPDTKVVMHSGFGGRALETAARALGASDFVAKAVPLRELPDRLLRTLGAPLSAERPPGAAATDEDSAAQALLAQHLERFGTVFDQAAIGMATMTLSGTLVRSNAALAVLTGRADSALIGLRYAELAGTPESAMALRRAIVRLGRGDTEMVETEHPLAGDVGTWARSTLAAVSDSDGRPLYLFVQMEDITQRRHALDDLRASEERFRLLVESVTDYAIFMLDPSGHVASWNAGAERMKGYRAGDIIGTHFRVFYPPEQQAVAHPEHELRLAVRDGRYEEEGWRVRRDGTRFWANVVITALFDHARHLVGFGKVTRDMTERRLAEEQLRAAKDEAVNVLDITAHELHSPIAAMAGAADIMAEYWDRLTPDEQAENIRNLTGSAARARRLLDDLLTASRLESGSIEFRITDVPVDVAIREAHATVGSGLSPVEVVGAAGVTVEADATRIVQMLTNFLSNAGRYGAPPVTVEVLPTGATVEVRVCDHGPGVAEDLEPRLFRKFVRGKGRPDRGTGLGLFIVAELARRQNGGVWYERRGDQTCFGFRLPAGRPPES